MAQRPLKLRSEKARTTTRASKFERIAEVVIDHEIAHLDRSFSYGIPMGYENEISVGSRVIVDFNRATAEGVVCDIRNVSSGTFKPIFRVINSYSYSESSLRLARELANRYATSEMRILKFFPERHLKAETSLDRKTNPIQPRFLQESGSTFNLLRKHLEAARRPVILIFPTEREAQSGFNLLESEFGIRLLRYLPSRSKRTKESFESAVEKVPNPIIVGTRSSVFLQVTDLAELIIFNEQSEHYWEKRVPYWNVRDVALKRASLQGIELTFIGGVPSLELLRLIDIGYVRMQRNRFLVNRPRRVTFEPEHFHKTIKSSLVNGPVLISVALPNYAKSPICRRCQSHPVCICGCSLRPIGVKRFECLGCANQINNWRCRECGSTELILLQRGAERIHEELGKAFPNVPIAISTGAKPLEQTPPAGIIIATVGMEPRTDSYAGLVVLDALARLNYPALRSEERFLDHIFRLISYIPDASPIFLSLPANHRIAQAVISRNPRRCLDQLLHEREDTKMPPWYRIIKLRGEGLSNLEQHLSMEFPSVLVSRINSNRELIVRSPLDIASEVIASLSSLQRYRSASRRGILQIEVDPFDI